MKVIAFNFSSMRMEVILFLHRSNSAQVLIRTTELGLGYIDGLGDAVEQGLVKAVGVSNYSGWF